MADEVQEFVLKLIRKKGKLPDGVDLDTFNYIDTGYVDSLGIIKFVVEIESAFDIEIADADIEAAEFKTVGGVVSIIRGKLSQRDT